MLKNFGTLFPGGLSAYQYENEQLLGLKSYVVINYLFIFFPNISFHSWEASPQNSVDYYDCRKRLWYTQGTAPSKDILIALDVSGTMYGDSFEIAKLGIKTLLDTLQDNDFFNIIYFNTKVHFVLPCKRLLLQATTANKILVKQAVDKIPAPTDELFLASALKAAFQILLDNKNSSFTTSSCSQMIMYFSDGINRNEDLNEVFDEYNAKRSVRVFVYRVGNKHRRTDQLKELACQNSGYYYELPTVGM